LAPMPGRFDLAAPLVALSYRVIGEWWRHSVFDRDVFALHVARFAQTPPECGKQIRHLLGRRGGVEKADHRHRRLLRARSERPCCRADNHRYELTPSIAVSQTLRTRALYLHNPWLVLEIDVSERLPVHDGPARSEGALSTWRGRYPNQNHVPFCGLLPDYPQLRAACLHHWPQRQSYHRCHACGRRVAVWRDCRADWCADLVTPRRFPPPCPLRRRTASDDVRRRRGGRRRFLFGVVI
jgi:hypothetical protein